MDQNDIAKALGPFTHQLYAILDAATHEAKAFFDNDQRPFSPSLFPGLVRYGAKLQWDQWAAAPHDVGALAGFERVPLLNDGLGFRSAGFNIRVWKTDEGRLPSPGSSQTKREFLTQGTLFDGWMQMAMADADPEWSAAERLNLALLWDVEPSHLLSSLVLVCPEGDADGGFGEAWRVPIPHPAEAASEQAPPPQTAHALDLDIQLTTDSANQGMDPLAEEGAG